MQLILVPDYLNVCLISEVNAPKDKKAERFIEQQIGGYIVEKELGRGGFGAAYLARRIRDNQRVALRICNLMPFSDYNRIVSGKAHAR